MTTQNSDGGHVVTDALRSFSVDTVTGEFVQGMAFRRDKDGSRYIQVLVPTHEIERLMAAEPMLRRTVA
jgi:hypothetical protein